MNGVYLVSFCLFAATFALPAQKYPYKTRTVKIGPTEPDPDPAYLYECVVRSTAEYRVAKAMGPLLRAGGEHVCYGDLGCFFKNGTYGNFWALPDSPESIATKFLLFTDPAQLNPQLLEYNNPASIIQSAFRPEQPTTIFIHGFGNSPRTVWIHPFRAAVFKALPKGNYIHVDWELGAKPPNYWGASANTQIVGAEIARLIANINTHLNTTSDSFHLIGYSLGAHVAGFTGHRLIQYGHKRVGKITGLDPAGPIFEEGHADAILSTGDADFVSGLHGNGATLSNGGFGLYTRVGDIDFYPNGGQYQPGCPHTIWGTLTNLITLNWGSLPESVKCNHHRVIELAMESVNPDCSFVSFACDNYAAFKSGQCTVDKTGTMGMFSTNVVSHQPHFLVTKDVGKDGFCAKALKVTIELSYNSDSTTGSIFAAFVGANGIEETVETIADEEDFKGGEKVIEIVASRFTISDLRQIKLRYEPDCGWFSCPAERINIDRVTVEDFATNTHKVCGGYTVLYKEDIVAIPLGNCLSYPSS